MNKYLEPLILADSDDFLSGTNEVLAEKYEEVTTSDMALHLFYDQNLISDYCVWFDYWQLHTKYIYDNPNFQLADMQISKEMSLINPDREKIAMKARLNYLKLKKQGLATNLEYFNFKDEISSDLYEILKIIGIQRFLYDQPDEFLEKIFFVMKLGCFPCGIKTNGTIVIYNPINIKLL